MPRNATRNQDSSARSADELLPIDRERILARAENAFYAVAQTFLSEFTANEPDLYPESEVDTEGRPVACDGGTVTVCPHCDSTAIRSLVGANYYASEPCEGSHYCRDCDEYFDEPAERPPKQSAGHDGLSRALIEASPEDLATDGGRDSPERDQHVKPTYGEGETP